jgi:hypothetical protein
MGLAALTFLSGDAQAVKYRPIPGSNPWHKDASLTTIEKPDWKINYYVPNFGVDQDIVNSQTHMAQSEKNLGQKMEASFKKPKSHPVDYPVANFGQDENVKLTLANIAQSESDLKHKWSFVDKKNRPKPHPVDYYVPNFGQDKDVKDSLAHTSQSEKNLNHQWNPVPKKDQPKQHPTDYFVPNFGVDEDVKNTQAHIAAQEAKHGSWKPVQDDNGFWIVPGPAENRSYTYNALVQTDAKEQSDPICPSSGCNYASEKGKATHPMNYFVPNFGRDRLINETDGSLDWAQKNLKHTWVPTLKSDLPKGPPKDYFVPNFGVDEDIKSTQAHVAAQEKRLKHVWKPKQDDNGVWIVPEPINNKAYSYNSLVQTDTDIKTESDPMCSSAGCTFKARKDAKTHPMNYFVPNFGVDEDIGDSHSSLNWAEKNLKHTWVPVLKDDQPKSHPVDYFVPKFGLDEDIKNTQANIAAQETRLKTKWVPEQDDNGVWIVPEANKNKSYSYANAQLLQTDAEVESDPICHSAGCPKSKADKKTHPMNYFVPNFGKDKDVKGTWASLDWA